MKDPQTLADELNASRERTLDAIGGVPEGNFFIKPDPGSWSVGEVMEHIILLESYVNRIFTGTVEATEDRRPDEKAEQIREALGSDRKLSAPEPIAPKFSIKDKEDAIRKFSFARDQLSRFILNYDLGETCLDFKHAFFGYLTRLEWTVFVIAHADRHLKQIQRVKDALTDEYLSTVTQERK